ncbi:uncharacterized protein LOC131585970 [Poecile atricapillus]|uniref:uncharacterized protein LOC131585970 n=1 Tax=Poecile atricapillus TaxID=48891 RepID=UPI002738407C|nr:uncharacterized protein LOC131585970 [Poecile atricapillus]
MTFSLLQQAANTSTTIRAARPPPRGYKRGNGPAAALGASPAAAEPLPLPSPGSCPQQFPPGHGRGTFPEPPERAEARQEEDEEDEEDEDEEDAAGRTRGAAAPAGSGGGGFAVPGGKEFHRPRELLESPRAGAEDTRPCPGLALVPSARERLPRQDLSLDVSSAPGPRALSLGWDLDAPSRLHGRGAAGTCSSQIPRIYSFWHLPAGTGSVPGNLPRDRCGKAALRGYNSFFFCAAPESWLWRRKDPMHSWRTNPAAPRARAEGSG